MFVPRCCRRLRSAPRLRACLLLGAGARRRRRVKIGLILPMTGGQASTGKQIDNAVKLYMQQHGDTVAGKKIEIILKDDAAAARQHQAPGAGTDRQRQGQFHRRLRRHAGGAGRSAAGDAGQDTGSRDGGGHLDHHRAFALYRAHQLHAGAVLHHHRRLGGQERHQEGRDADLRLRARQRRAELLQGALHRRRRRDRRRGQGAARPIPTSRRSCSG